MPDDTINPNPDRDQTKPGQNKPGQSQPGQQPPRQGDQNR